MKYSYYLKLYKIACDIIKRFLICKIQKKMRVVLFYIKLGKKQIIFYSFLS